MNKIFFVLVFAILVSCKSSDCLKDKVAKLANDNDFTLGLAIYDYESDILVTLNGDKHFPMQSVYKFPIALAVLDYVDNQKLSLMKPVFIAKRKLKSNTWSPIQQKFPNQDVEISLRELVYYSVNQSDNNGTDVLLEMIGGAKVVNDYIGGCGIDDIAIENTEAELKSDWQLQFNNSITPNAAIELLRKFDSGVMLHENTQEFLIETMTNTVSENMKKGLPDGSVVIHKTGASGYRDGVSAATNDIGIIIMPNKRKIAYAIFITDSKESQAEIYNIFTKIATLIYESYGQ